MMSYTTALLELRQMIADTQYNKRSTKKKLVGDVDGSNKLFYSYDKRILGDTLDVFVDNEKVCYDLNDAISGEIQLKNAPEASQSVTASYYWTWWTDDELTNFLNKGAQMCGQISPEAESDPANDQSYLLIPPGLRNGALNFAASLADTALVQYLVARKHSQEFALEQDGGDDEGYSKFLDSLSKAASTFMKTGMTMRDDFYKAQGRQYSPAFGIKVVATRQYGPRR